VTVNVTAVLVPAGEVTVTFLAPPAAPVEITKVAVTEVSLTKLKPLTVMPPPLTAAAVAPVSPLPVRVTGTLVPRLPELGAIEARDGPFTVYVMVLLVPPSVVTLMFLVPSVAAVVLVMVAVIVVALTTVTPLTVTPLAGAAMLTVDPAMKLVPVRVTETAVPRRPALGAIEVSVGAGGATTVKVTGLVAPAGVVTVTFLAVSVAVGAIVKVAVTVVALTAVTPLTVMPPPDTVTAVAPVRSVPVIVTGTMVPCAPVGGAIEVTAPTPLPWNSTAPTSNRFGTLGSGLELPKKSVLGATAKVGEELGT
jgi:hypothetical protein